MAKDKKNKYNYKQRKLEDTYAWEGAVGTSAAQAAHWEYKVRSGKIDKLLKQNLKNSGMPNPTPKQFKQLRKMTVNLGRGGSLLNGLMMGGLVGSLVDKKSGKAKKKHNREVNRKRRMSKKAEYIADTLGIEKVAWKGPTRRVLSFLGKHVKGVGGVVEDIAPIIKTTRQRVAKNKYIAPKLKKVQGAGKSFMNWADNPGSFIDPKSKHYITGKKTGWTSGINPAWKRQLATGTGRVLGMPIRHPLGTAVGAWGAGKFIGSNKQLEHETMMHNLTNRPSYATKSKVQEDYERNYFMPDSTQTNYVMKLPKEQGGMAYTGRPVTQKELDGYYLQHSSLRPMLADNLITSQEAASRFPTWYNFDDMDQVLQSRNHMLNGNIDLVNQSVVGKYKNKIPSADDYTTAYHGIKANNTPGDGTAHGVTVSQHDKERPSLWSSLKNLVGYGE